MRLFPAIVVVALTLTAACEHRVDAALLHVEGLDAERLEPGSTLRVAGRGFPPGGAGTIRLVGLAHRPGQRPAPVRVAADARAHSSERLAFECTREMVAALGGRGTFVGTLRVEFPGVGGAVLSGELEPVILAVRAGGVGAMSGALTREREGRELLDRLGITPSTEDVGSSGGIEIESFAEGSVAERSGVQKRDRITALGPMYVDDVGDLVPPPGARAATLVMERPGLSQPVRVVVALRPTESGPSAPTLYAASAAAGLAALLFLLLSPAARLTTRVFVALSAPGPSVVTTLLAVQPIPADAPLIRRASRLSWVTVSIAAVVVALGVLPFMARILPGALDAGILVMIAVGLAAAVRAALPADEPAARRLSGVLWAVVSSAPAIVAVSVVALPLGTFRIEALVGAQAGVPWGWNALASVPALLALPAAVISLIILPFPPARGTAALVLDRVRLFVGASLITIVFLGGFRLPFFAADPLLASPMLRLAAALFFVIKSVAVVAAASRLRREARDPRALLLFSVASAVLAAGSAIALVAFPGSVLPRAAVGPVAFVVTLVVAAVGLQSARRDRGARYDAGVALFS